MGSHGESSVLCSCFSRHTKLGELPGHTGDQELEELMVGGKTEAFLAAFI